MSAPRLTDAAPLLIRPVHPGDGRELARVAALDDALLPPAPLLVAEVGGELWAAVSLATLEIIANPFRPSAEPAALLRQRALDLGASVPRPRRWGRAVRPWRPPPSPTERRTGRWPAPAADGRR